ncbi:unnamed protein product [Arabidopsis halleri]
MGNYIRFLIWFMPCRIRIVCGKVITYSLCLLCEIRELSMFPLLWICSQ